MGQAYARLRAAVLAYAEALQRYAAFGDVWAEPAPDLDELWADVIDATTPEPDAE